MKKINMFFVVLFTLLSVSAASAQDENYVTEENLRRYALMSEAIDVMKAEISVVLNDMIKSQEGIDGKRYTELAGGKGEPATEFETKFMEKTEEMKNERIEAIKQVNQLLAVKMLPDGGKAYKAIKSALSSDAEVKAKYDAIVAKLQLAEETGA